MAHTKSTKTKRIKKERFVIIDWAGNHLFQDETWADFDDAEEFLSLRLGDDYETDREEYYIVPESDVA